MNLFWNEFNKKASKLKFLGIARPTVPMKPPVQAERVLDYKKLRQEMMRTKKPPTTKPATPRPDPDREARMAALRDRITDPVAWRRALAKPVGK